VSYAERDLFFKIKLLEWYIERHCGDLKRYDENRPKVDNAKNMVGIG
jgi:hypothetical protein